MALDVDAPSKAAAEKKAHEAGMDVQHIQPVAEGNDTHERHSHRGEDVDSGKSEFIVKLLIGLALVAAIAWFVLPWIRGAMR